MDGGRKFSQGHNLSLERIEAFQSDIYRAKPSVKKQRLARIRFLHKLCDIYGLTNENKSQNWRIFLYYHGADFESEEEVDLWKDIISCHSGKQVNSEKINIPPIEFRILCRGLLSQCVPIQPETLFCYQGGSPLHMGGLAEFLTKYPSVLQTCTMRVVNSPDWDQVLEQYLEYWSILEYDLEEIRAFCRSDISKWQWKRIPYASNAELKTFCKEMCEKLSIEWSPSYGFVEELKTLLVEAAIRNALAQKASSILYKQIEKRFRVKLGFESYLHENR